MIRTTVMAATFALACAVALHGHHVGTMYQTTPVWVQGTVVQFEGIDPHTITTVREARDDGQVRLWGVEGPAQFQLARLGLQTEVPQVGDVVQFCIFRYKPVEELSRLFPDGDFSRLGSRLADTPPTEFGAGHVLVKSNGGMRLWEPHGLLSECMRGARLPREAWLAFLKSDSGARQGWCQQQAYDAVRTNATLRAFIAEIDRLLGEPCEGA